jgi:hypothetical protein
MNTCHTRETRDAEYDVKGIFLTFTCPKCRAEKLRTYSPMVLTEEQQMVAYGEVTATSYPEEECLEEDY